MKLNQKCNREGFTHNSRHVGALVRGGHQCSEVGFTAHAHLRRTLVLHVFGDAAR